MSTTTSESTQAKECPLAVALARRLRASRTELASRWLERIEARVSIPPNRVFPSKDLLNHVPILIDGIANYLEDPTSEVGSDPVVAKARELGELRHRQGFDAYQIMKEYEILGGILFHAVSSAADEIPETCSKK